MKKIQLYKTAIDFAFTNVDVKDAVTLAEYSIAAFKAGGFDSQDLHFWEQTWRQALQQFGHLKNQLLPSEVAAKQAAPMAPASEQVS